MTTLEDLYYGNISPCEHDMKRGSRMDKLVKLICKNEESADRQARADRSGQNEIRGRLDIGNDRC